MAELATVEPRLRARKVAVARAAGHRRLRLALTALALPVLVVVVLLVLHSPLLSARHVEVTGASHTSEASVLAVTGLGHHPPLIDVNPAAETAALERLPWVAKASVEPRWPSGVRVHLVERVPALEVRGRGGTVSVLDRTGRVITVVAPGSPILAGLVVLRHDGPVPAVGAFLGPSYRAELAVAASIPRQLVPHVAFVGAAAGGAVVVRLVEGPLALIGPPSDLAQKMVSLSTIIASVAMAGVATIDLRVPAAPVLTP